MTDAEQRSPEDWEAEDIIEDLKSTLPRPGESPRPLSADVCRCHTHTLIWIVRHMERREQRGFAIPAALASAVATVFVGLVEGLKYLFGGNK